MAYYNLNEALKRKEEREKAERANHDEGIHLDDVTRVKVLSPGRQVIKRFVRNRLARARPTPAIQWTRAWSWSVTSSAP